MMKAVIVSELRNTPGTREWRMVEKGEALFHCFGSDGAGMVAEPAEVPMPEPDYRGPAEAGDYFSGYTHTTMRTYGAACRAAGEATGYARGLKEAGRDARVGLTPASADVLAERQRQISAEGWTPEHDDEHDLGEMAVAASCYCDPDLVTSVIHGTTRASYIPPPRWPWAKEWWKPADSRRNLVKAGALILAEIERLDRAALHGEVTA